MKMIKPIKTIIVMAIKKNIDNSSNHQDDYRYIVMMAITTLMMTKTSITTRARSGASPVDDLGVPAGLTTSTTIPVIRITQKYQ